MNDLLVRKMTNQEMVEQFHEAFEVDIEERKIISADLIGEEFDEVMEELQRQEYVGTLLTAFPLENVDVEALAKELSDLLYVAYGSAEAYGIDLDKAFELVHESNMSKLGDDGRPVRREDGKVLKGPNYKAPDMTDAIQG